MCYPHISCICLVFPGHSVPFHPNPTFKWHDNLVGAASCCSLPICEFCILRSAKMFSIFCIQFHSLGSASWPIFYTYLLCSTAATAKLSQQRMWLALKQAKWQCVLFSPVGSSNIPPTATFYSIKYIIYGLFHGNKNLSLWNICAVNKTWPENVVRLPRNPWQTFKLFPRK